MPDERSDRLLRAIAATVGGDTRSVGELFTEDVVASSPTVAVESLVELAVELEDDEDGFTDVELHAGTTVSSGDRLCTEWVASATHSVHSGPVTGPRPKEGTPRITLRGVTVAEFDGARIRAVRHYWNETDDPRPGPPTTTP